MRKRCVNRYAKNGGAPRRRLWDIREKPEGGVFNHPPPARRGLRSQTIPQFTDYLHRSSWPPRSWPSRSNSRSNDRNCNRTLESFEIFTLVGNRSEIWRVLCFNHLTLKLTWKVMSFKVVNLGEGSAWSEESFESWDLNFVNRSITLLCRAVSVIWPWCWPWRSLLWRSWTQVKIDHEWRNGLRP